MNTISISKKEYEHLKELDERTKKIMHKMAKDLEYLQSREYKKKLKETIEKDR